MSNKTEKERPPKNPCQWAGPPGKAKPENWDLFIACGEVVLLKAGEWRGALRREPSSLLFSEMADQVRPLLETGELFECCANGAGEDELQNENEEETPTPRIGRQERVRKATEKDLGLALELLKHNPLRHFPFLSDGTDQPPTMVVILVAALAAAYFFERGNQTISERMRRNLAIRDLRPYFGLMDRRPHRWQGYGEMLESYIRKHGAFLRLDPDSEGGSGMDSSISLSRLGYQKVLGLERPEAEEGDEEDREDRRPMLFRILRRQREEKKREPRVVTLDRPQLTLKALVLPPCLRSEIWLAAGICERLPKSPPTLLFTGPPGTGKTHAARALAGSLKRPLATVDLSRTLDCYVGDTEKNLALAFKEAEEAGAVLLLDEADALAYDRAGTRRSWELSFVNTVLKLLESPSVPTILCTNLSDKLDPALHRRIQYLLCFPIPGAAERKAIWGLELRRRRLRRSVDLDRLSLLVLTGGLIYNAVKYAHEMQRLFGRKAAVTMETLLEAAAREIPKMGKVLPAYRPIGFG